MNARNITSILILLLFVGSAFPLGLHSTKVQAVTPNTTLNVGLNRFATIPSLNPYSPVYVNPLDSEMYLRCVHVDNAPAKHFTDVLCTGESSNSNYTSWTMNLMSGLKWSDGSPLNATDLAGSLLDGNATGYFAPYLTSVKIVNSTAVTATVSIPQPNWLENMENIFIVPYENFGKIPLSSIANYTAFTNIVAAGPYILPSYTAGTNPLIMVPNQYFHLGNNQYYSQVIVHIFQNLQSMSSAMLAGQIDIMWYAGTAQSTTPYNVSGISVFLWTHTQGYQILNLNYLKAPLNNDSFRQGLAYATDRNAIATTVNGPGFSLITYGGGPTVQPGENTYPYNTTAAIAMFQKAGLTESNGKLQYSNGTQVSLTIQIPTGEPDSQNIATIVGQQWAKVGINVVSQVTDATTLYADFGTGAWSIASIQEDGITGRPIRYSDQLQSSGLTITTEAATPGAVATANQYVTPQIGQLIINQSLVPTGSSQFDALTAQITPLVAQQVVSIPFYTSPEIVIYKSSISFGTNTTDPNQATGIYSYQTDVQEPYDATTFYYAHPLAGSTSASSSSVQSTISASGVSSSAAQSTTSTSAVASTSSTSSSSSTSISSSYLLVLGVVLVVLASSVVLAFSRKRKR
ncbi:MAG: ABC transporter substrate-binding protein [Nitrososphaerales archaeon]